MDEVVRSAKQRLLVKARRSRREISQRKREEFILFLSESCNVTGSAARAGLAWSTVYRLRQRDAAFAAAWQRALEDGYERLEMGLIQAALAVVEGRPEGEDPATPGDVIAPMTVEQALSLLRHHGGSVRGGKPRTHRPGKGKMPTSEETDEEVLKRLAVLRRQRGWDQL